MTELRSKLFRLGTGWGRAKFVSSLESIGGDTHNTLKCKDKAPAGVGRALICRPLSHRAVLPEISLLPTGDGGGAAM